MRRSNTTRTGYGFSAAVVQAVWNKGRPIPGYDANSVRADVCGAVMFGSQYGDTSSVHGWEIDHIQPVAMGGGRRPLEPPATTMAEQPPQERQSPKLELRGLMTSWGGRPPWYYPCDSVTRLT